MAFSGVSEKNMTNMGPVIEPILTKMIACPRVGILKMILCSAARPRTENIYVNHFPGDHIASEFIFESLIHIFLNN